MPSEIKVLFVADSGMVIIIFLYLNSKMLVWKQVLAIYIKLAILGKTLLSSQVV